MNSSRHTQLRLTPTIHQKMILNSTSILTTSRVVTAIKITVMMMGSFQSTKTLQPSALRTMEKHLPSLMNVFVAKKLQRKKLKKRSRRLRKKLKLLLRSVSKRRLQQLLLSEKRPLQIVLTNRRMPMHSTIMSLIFKIKLKKSLHLGVPSTRRPIKPKRMLVVRSLMIKTEPYFHMPISETTRHPTLQLVSQGRLQKHPAHKA